MPPQVTLLDLVCFVSRYARSEAEVIATVAHMVNSAHVRLCGTFSGARFDLRQLGLAAGAGYPSSMERREDT